MKFFQKIKAEHLVHKLKTARSLERAELEAVQQQIVSAGPAAIEPMLRCLGHAEARPPALEILQQLLGDATLGLYVQALASPNPAVASGVTQVLAGSSRYRPGALLVFLMDDSIPKAGLETVLAARAASIPPREALAVLLTLGKEGRAVLFRVLKKTLTPRAAGELVPLLAHEDGWVRLQATELLRHYDDPRVVQGLVGVLADENRNVRLEAVKGLHHLRARDGIPGLVQRLRDGDLKVQTAAIEALTDFGDTTAVPHLLSVLADESEQARRGAVEVLNEVATTEAIQDLLRALHDADWWVRVRAADALGALGGDKVVDAVLGLLSDSEEFLRRYAVEILNTLPHEKTVLPLIRALEDPDWWVRERAIDALGKSGDLRAVQPLLDLMLLEPQAVPLCARALGALDDGGAIEPLTDLVHDERAEVRREAVEALRLLARGKRTEKEREAILGALGRGSQGKQSGAPGPFRLERNRSQRPSAEPVPTQASSPPAPVAAPAKTPDPAHLNFANLPEGTGLLDRYRILRRIGSGGFGTVYLVRDGAVQEDIILKVLNPLLSVDATSIRRFVQELKLTRRVTHRNVIRIYDFLDLGGSHAVSMEYFASRDLGRLLSTEGAQSPQRTLRLVAQICAGLAAAHDEGVVHRDIKPANILVGDDETVKIVDFGLASVQQQGGSRLTRSGLLIGTPEYMAPELIQNEPVDPRCDLYSLGIMMYEMLSGRRPYEAETPVKILFQHLEGEPQPLGQLVPSLPASLQALVASTMARAPEARPFDARRLLTSVEAELNALGAGSGGA